MSHYIAMATFHLIVNSRAGGGRSIAAADRVAAALRARGARVRTTASVSVQAVDELVSASVRLGERCVAVGGDGTVSSIAGSVVRHGGTLGIVPAGRGNDFSRQLAIPSGAAAQATWLMADSPTAVDAIDVGGKVVVGSVYAGVDSRTSMIVNGLHRMPALLQYPYGAIRALATFPLTSYRVMVDNDVFEYDGFTAVVANSGYYGKGMHIAPQADVRDALLEVVLLGAGGRARFISRLPSVYRGTHTRHPEVVTTRGRVVTIEAQGVEAYADGEPLATLPITARVLPGALKVMLG